MVREMGMWRYWGGYLLNRLMTHLLGIIPVHHGVRWFACGTSSVLEREDMFLECLMTDEVCCVGL